MRILHGNSLILNKLGKTLNKIVSFALRIVSYNMDRYSIALGKKSKEKIFKIDQIKVKAVDWYVMPEMAKFYMGEITPTNKSFFGLKARHPEIFSNPKESKDKFIRI